MNGIAGGVLLGFGPQGFDMTDDKLAQSRAAGRCIFQPARRQHGKFAADLHDGPGDCHAVTKPTLQADRALVADRGGFHHLPVAHGDEAGDHAGMGKIGLVYGIARVETHVAVRQDDLLTIRLQQSPTVLRQRGDQPVVRAVRNRHPLRQDIHPAQCLLDHGVAPSMQT